MERSKPFSIDALLMKLAHETSSTFKSETTVIIFTDSWLTMVISWVQVTSLIFLQKLQRNHSQLQTGHQYKFLEVTKNIL